MLRVVILLLFNSIMISAILKAAEKSHFALRGKTIGIVGAGM
jgi:phosphoglycerate dehydrogenase-like enzyme